MKFLIVLLSLITIPTLSPMLITDNSVSNNPTPYSYSKTSHQMIWKQTDTQANEKIKNTILNDSRTGINPYWWPALVESYSGIISDKYTENGVPSFRFELRRDDPLICNGKRAEVHQFIPESPLEEHTYYFDILLPKGGEEDYKIDEGSSEILAQWHNNPDKGEDWTIPPLALTTINERYVLETAWDDEPFSTDRGISAKGNKHKYELGSFVNDKGRFVKWAFHIKWGWLASQKPILEVYKDGEKILDLSGIPNTMNDKLGIRQQLGVYKWDWQGDPFDSVVDERVVYYNNVHTD